MNDRQMMPEPDDRVQPFAEYLMARNLRFSVGRLLVAQAAFALPQPPDRDQVLREVKLTSGRRRVRRSFVYRTLDLLNDAGLL